jgi:hypothetical protein
MAFDSLTKSIADTAACLEGTGVGTGAKMAEVFISFALSLGRVVIFDKLSSLSVQIEPVVDELRPIDSLVRQSTPLRLFRRSLRQCSTWSLQ